MAKNNAALTTMKNSRGQVNVFTDNTPERFRAYGWHVIEHVDGHNPDQIKAAVIEAQKSTDKPVLICTKTIIGFGSPNKAATHDVHGSPLGDAEIKAVRENLNWSHAPFEIPQDYYSAWNATQKGLEFEKQWQELFLAYSKKYPELAAEYKRRIKHTLPETFQSTIENTLTKFSTTPENIASRKASQNCINALAPILPEFLGGSADLTGSNLTMAKTAKPITPEDFSGNYIYYGVREFGMSAIMCGISLHGGFIPFGGTFLTFCDYARNAVRLAALMKIRVIFVYSHDSIGLGEDGPTHQPVEHIGMLRLTPGLSLWRPCDPVETMVAWQVSIENFNKPTCLLLSRQNLPQQIHTDINLIKKGGYILSDSEKNPEIILIATGSEVYLATEAAKILREQHHKSVRVVSMPSVDTFLLQDQNYQETVLPKNIKNRIAIEAGAKDIWYRFVGFEGKIIGMDSFGESAPAADIYKALGITTENIVKTALTD